MPIAGGDAMKITEQKNGAWTVFEKRAHGYYLVKLFNPSGWLHDKILCDTRAGALEYLRAFNRIAKQF